jgi:hypothetical protein
MNDGVIQRWAPDSEDAFEVENWFKIVSSRVQLRVGKAGRKSFLAGVNKLVCQLYFKLTSNFGQG